MVNSVLGVLDGESAINSYLLLSWMFLPLFYCSFKVICRVEETHVTCSLRDRLHYATTVLSPTVHCRHGMAFKHLEKFLEKCGPDRHFFVGSEVTIADFAAFHLVDLHMTMFQRYMNRFPCILEHHEYIKALPAIKDYLASSKRYPDVWVVDWLAMIKKDMDMDMFFKMAPGIVKGM